MMRALGTSTDKIFLALFSVDLVCQSHVNGAMESSSHWFACLLVRQLQALCREHAWPRPSLHSLSGQYQWDGDGHSGVHINQRHMTHIHPNGKDNWDLIPSLVFFKSMFSDCSCVRAAQKRLACQFSFLGGSGVSEWRPMLMPWWQSHGSSGICHLCSGFSALLQCRVLHVFTVHPQPSACLLGSHDLISEAEEEVTVACWFNLTLLLMIRIHAVTLQSKRNGGISWWSFCLPIVWICILASSYTSFGFCWPQCSLLHNRIGYTKFDS